MQVTIAGSGGWGTALAILLHENGHDVTLWSHFETESKQLAETHQNPYLPGVTLPEGLHYSADPACAQGREMVVFATPSFAVRTTAHAFAPYLAETPLLVSVTKGIEEGTGYRMSELVSQETGRTVVALSGPSHAEEVSRGIPTGVVVACPERELAERVQNAFMCSRFRVYTSPDTAGIELGAALKNVIALCAGVCDGMGYGDNTKALLMTRGLAEVARLGMALGAHRETFAGLAGVGDLIVTCTSMHSRNRRAGILIGQGVPVQEAMKQVGAVVEGYYAAQSAWELAQRKNVDMPITEAAYAVLYEGRDPREALNSLMLRDRTSEAGRRMGTVNRRAELLRSLKFTLFSASAGLIQIGAFALCNDVIHLPAWLGYLIALVLSVLWNFTLNRRYTFRSAASVPRAMALVALFYLVFTPCTTWLEHWLTDVKLWNDYLVTALNMVLNLVLEFLYDRFVVFRGTIDSRDAK